MYILATKACEEDPLLFCPSGYDETDPGNCASVGYSTKVGTEFWRKPVTSDKDVVYSFVHGADFDAWTTRFTSCDDCCEEVWGTAA